MTKILLALLILSSLLFFACTANKGTIDKEQLANLLTRDSVKIIDVRTKEEYDRGHSPGAINYPIESLKDNLKFLDQSEKIIVVCRSGNRSRKARKLLIKNEFSEVYDGGKWQNIDKLLKKSHN